MLNQFLNWFGKNRKPIGYTIGTVNVLGALQYFYQGENISACVSLVLGLAILLDTWEFK